MSRTPRKQEEIERIREQIIKEAVCLFYEKGILDTRIDDIAARLEVAKGTIYNYFSSKYDIILSAMSRKQQQILKQLSMLHVEVSAGLPFDAAVDRLIDIFIDFEVDHRIFFDVFRKGQIWARQAKKEDYFEDMQRSFVEVMKVPAMIFAEYMARGDMIEQDPRDLGFYFMSIFRGITIKERILSIEPDMERNRVFIRQVFLSGVRRPKGEQT